MHLAEETHTTVSSDLENVFMGEKLIWDWWDVKSRDNITWHNTQLYSPTIYKESNNFNNFYFQIPASYVAGSMV